jgi:hypothetical protein
MQRNNPTRREQRSPPVMVCGISPICSFASATLRQRSNVSWRPSCGAQLTKPVWFSWMIWSSAGRCRNSLTAYGRCSRGSGGLPETQPGKVPYIPEGISVSGTHRITGRSDSRPGEAGDLKALSAAKGQTRAQKLSRAVYHLLEIHRWIYQHRQTADSTPWREVNLQVVPGGRRRFLSPEVGYLDDTCPRVSAAEGLHRWHKYEYHKWRFILTSIRRPGTGSSLLQ